MTSRTSTAGFNDSEHRAIERFLTSRTVPLTYQKDGKAFVQGTGCFYRTNDDLFLVTAAHVLQGIDPALLGVPDRPVGNVGVWHLSDIAIYHPRDTENFDIVVIELLNPDFKTQVASSWQYIDESEIFDDPEIGAEFLIGGYPSASVEDRDGTLTPAPMLQLFTKSYEPPPSETLPEYDLLLRYKHSGRGIYGAERATPSLHGVSGATVYAKTQSNSAVWSPEAIFRPVGIQVSMKHDEFVRVKKWASGTFLTSTDKIEKVACIVTS